MARDGTESQERIRLHSLWGFMYVHIIKEKKGRGHIDTVEKINSLSTNE